jgi:hypothetical protein
MTDSKWPKANFGYRRLDIADFNIPHRGDPV